MKPRRILIADDCENTRALVDIALAESGYQLDYHADGESALRQCKQSLPDLAILDIQMPGATGIEICTWLKEQSGEYVPVVLLTSQVELVDKVNGFDCGADDYVTKPFALPELAARARALMRVKELTDRLIETNSKLEQKEKQLVAIQVAGAAAHELGQPLTAMLLNCELLAKLSPGDHLFRSTLGNIQDQCDMMRNVLNQLNRVQDYKTKSYVGALNILDFKTSP